MSPSRLLLPPSSRRSRPHRVGVAALLLGTVVLVGACSTAASDQASTAPAPMPPGIAVEGGPAMAPGTPMGADAMTKDAGADRSIVRTSTITVRVDALDAAAAQWRATVAGLGGIVSDEYAGDDGTTPYATITAKVPASRLDEAVAAARSLGQPLSVSTSASDVTLQVSDLDARISVLEASIDRLRALLDEATKVADVVAVETELTNRQAELDGLKAQQRALADQVDMAAITVSLVPAVAPADTAAPGFLAGLQSGWNALVTLARSATTALGMALPFLAIAGLIGLAGVTVARTTRRRRHRRDGHAGADPHAGARADDDHASG